MGVKTTLLGLTLGAAHQTNAFAAGHPAGALISEAVVHLNDVILLLKEIQKDVPTSGDGNLAVINAQIANLS
jgi:hypothetical protein